MCILYLGYSISVLQYETESFLKPKSVYMCSIIPVISHNYPGASVCI